MALQWFWDFGINLPVADYGNSGWSPSTTTNSNLDTQDTTRNQSPVGAGITPGDTHRVQLSTGRLTTPGTIFNLQQGWVAGRVFWFSGSTSTTGSIGQFCKLFESGTVRFEVRMGNGANDAVMQAYINGQFQAASLQVFNQQDVFYMAVGWDATTTTNSMRVYSEGIEVIPEVSRTGQLVRNINFWEISRGNAGMSWNTLSVWSDYVADLANATNKDTWSRTLSANAIANDASWSVFGGAASKLVSQNDGLSTTGVEATVASSFDLQYEDAANVLAGWSPDTIYGLQAVCLASGDVLTNGTLTLSDGGGVIASMNQNPIPTSPDFVHALALTQTGGGSLTAVAMDAATTNWSIA